ncbi:hypothetical protein MUK42_20144 [Musa troglodytarum]|uniref:Uncharacterized protein n=1 Tax=Musa troglodytarum TaxID=320322 RepID=A0A9E7G4L5_9LILI|nr:hypothetical protein MUK42_20144 [Musa troglodytarum]
MQVEIIDVSGHLIPVTIYLYLILDQVFQNLGVGIWSQEAYPLKVCRGKRVWRDSVFPRPEGLTRKYLPCGWKKSFPPCKAKRNKEE